VAGVPAKQIGWISRHGERLALPLAGRARATCPATGESYVLDAEGCRLADRA
jgi:UDP-2-acetamido-3-amino-2,3-dideoxy-glucuronate N-acetyltransferase